MQTYFKKQRRENENISRNISHKWTVLHSAARNNDVETLIELLKQPHTNPNIKDQCGTTPLHLGVNHINIVKQLLKAGADPNGKHDKNSRTTPLHKLLYLKNDNKKDIAELLLKNGANPNLQSSQGDAPIHSVCSRSNGYVDFDINELLLKYKTDPNVIGQSDGENAFHMLCGRYNSDKLLLKMIQKYNVNVNLVSKHNKTPLHIAVGDFPRNKQIIEALLKAGANPNKVSYELYLTPLQLAIWRKLIDITTLLLTYGANPNVYSNTKTPLHELLLNKSTKYNGNIKLILKKKANPNAVYINNYNPTIQLTPLDIACKNKNHMIIKTLIIYGARKHNVCSEDQIMRYTEALLTHVRKKQITVLKNIPEFNVFAYNIHSRHSPKNLPQNYFRILQ